VEVAGAEAAGDDLVVHVEQAAGPPTYAFTHRTGWFLPNTLLWFGLGFPSFWVRDRVYEVRWDVKLRVRSAPAHAELPEVHAYSLREERALHLAERGWTAHVLYTPPGLYEGPDTPAVLAGVVERWLVRQLAAFIKAESGALPFDVRIAIASPGNLTALSARDAALRLCIESPTVLERIRIELDGAVLWEKDPLTMVRATKGPDAPGGTGGFIYERHIPLDVSPGEHEVRVLARRRHENTVPVSGSAPTWSATRTVRFAAE
jgi:hypothetical protein